MDFFMENHFYFFYNHFVLYLSHMTGIFLILLFSASILAVIGFYGLDLFWYFKTIKYGKEYYFEKKHTKVYYSVEEEQYILQIFPGYSKFSREQQLKIQYRIMQFCQTYRVYPKHNVPFESRDILLIATSYVKLTLGYRTFLAKSMKYILVYPDAFYFQPENAYHKGHFNPKEKVVALSWKDFLQDYIAATDGRNIALHEFSHALMYYMLLSKNGSNSSALFKHYYAEIKNWLLQSNHKTLLQQSGFVRPYAFTNSYEFIAVIIELYFEQPNRFKEWFPSLFILVEKMLGQHKMN